MRIFVSIAAYRDPQLGPTLRDCVTQAARPELLHLGVIWQHGEDEPRPALDSAARLEVVDVDWRESRGACWARAQAMGLYDGESWFLQLDSHHRFVPGWDERLRALAAESGSPLPLLTSYAPAYAPGMEGAPDTFPGDAPLQLDFDVITDEGVLLVRPSAIRDWRDRGGCVRARFLSGHFLFAPGRFVQDVPYDPELYFHGEEITLAVRAFTHGYDLLHPCEIVLWHEYTRSYRPHKHWSDHAPGAGVAVDWSTRDRASKERVRRLLTAPWIGRDGCGTARTLADYERYAGVDFTTRRVRDATRRGEEPPTPHEPGWPQRVRRRTVRVTLDRAQVPPGISDWDAWYLALQDDARRDLSRADAPPDEVARALEAASAATTSVFASARDDAAAGVPPEVRPAAPVTFLRTLESEAEPARWTVCPRSVSAGWLARMEGPTELARGPATLVTALVDLGREALRPPFGRSFDDGYLPALAELLGTDAPMVVYVDPAHEAFVRARRDPRTTRVVPLGREDLEAFPLWELVQELRVRPDWRAQAPWLATSPQAELPHYVPLVCCKPALLAEAARENTFLTTHHFWVDAGLSRTVGAARVADGRLTHGLAHLAGNGILGAAFPYVGPSEIHGFPRDVLARLAGLATAEELTHVMRGGLFGGSAEAVETLARQFAFSLNATVRGGWLGTEESLLTLLAYKRPELVRVLPLGPDGLLGPAVDVALAAGDAVLRAEAAGRAVTADDASLAHLARPAPLARAAGPGAVRPRPPEAPPAAAPVPPAALSGGRELARGASSASAAAPAAPSLYVLTYNTPRQLAAWLEAAHRADPTLLSAPRRVLLDQSTEPATRDAYDALCARWGFACERPGNLGVNGGRVWCARHFDGEARSDAMFYFEDDMFVSSSPGVCRNGLPRHVPDLHDRALALARAEPALDFLKLSFTEYFGDHRENWAWHNLDAAGRARFFPDGHATRIEALRCHGGLSYAVGEIFFSNWPVVMGRRGNRALFLDGPDGRGEILFEQHRMVRWLELARAGALRSAVLLASPIEHTRLEAYAPQSRREV